MTLIASILVLTALTGSETLAAVTIQGTAAAEPIGTKALGGDGAERLNIEPLRPVRWLSANFANQFSES